jgi:acetyl esterase/lipase
MIIRLPPPLPRIVSGGILALLMGMTAISAAEPAPTLANVHYGPDERQVLDFWKAPSSTPTPVVFYIHGGAWLGSDKSAIGPDIGIERFLTQGISVVSTNYRYIKQTILKDKSVPLPVITPEVVATQNPPVYVPLHDAARALQFVRSKAAEWNIDPARIGLSGGSAGGCTCLWLAFHRDLADPASADPVARESTRPWCVALSEPQTTLDPKQMREWTPNNIYGGHAFGFAWNPNDQQAEFREFIAHRAVVLPWIEQYSPYSLLTAGAPPIYLYYPHDAPAYGKDRVDTPHTANFGAILEEKAKRLGVPIEFNYLGAPGIVHPTIADYLIWELKAPAAAVEDFNRKT